MRVYLLSLTLFVQLIVIWPVSSGSAQADVSQGELFLASARLSGSAASATFVCAAGQCSVQTNPQVRNRYHDFGWAGSITGNFNNYAGIEFDAGCCQKPGWPNGHQYTFSVGPHFAYRRNARLQPFAHVLLGLTHGRQVTPTQHSTWRPGFTAGFGGGLDVRVSRFLWARPIQADYFRDSFRDDVQKNSRLSFGIVVRFGRLPVGSR